MSPRSVPRFPGVSYATGFGGLELPVLDVTHPAFAPAPPERIAELTAQYEQQLERQAKTPQWLGDAMMKVLLRWSIIGKGLLAARGGYLRALPTYLLKLGPENLGSWAGRMDRAIAGSLPAVAMRLRLGDMARLLADGVEAELRSRPGVRLVLVNIAGGATADSLNALIVLRKEHPELLEGRDVEIRVLDAEDEAPAFGAAALRALQQPGAALHGVRATHRHESYDWRRPAELAGHLGGDGVLAASSEGGLFEYGTDEEIVENLHAFHAAVPGAAFVGSVTRADGIAPRLHASGGAAVRPRRREAFEALASQAGMVIEAEILRPISLDVRLR